MPLQLLPSTTSPRCFNLTASPSLSSHRAYTLITTSFITTAIPLHTPDTIHHHQTHNTVVGQPSITPPLPISFSQQSSFFIPPSTHYKPTSSPSSRPHHSNPPESATTLLKPPNRSITSILHTTSPSTPFFSIRCLHLTTNPIAATFISATTSNHYNINSLHPISTTATTAIPPLPVTIFIFQSPHLYLPLHSPINYASIMYSTQFHHKSSLNSTPQTHSPPATSTTRATPVVDAPN